MTSGTDPTGAIAEQIASDCSDRYQGDKQCDTEFAARREDARTDEHAREWHRDRDTERTEQNKRRNRDIAHP